MVPSMTLKKILIADDHPVFRKGISLLLKEEWHQLEIIEAANGLEIIDHYQNHQPDLLLIDYSMPNLNGYEAAEQLLKKNKELKIILFTMFDSTAVAFNFLKIGGRGFIAKGGHPDEIIKAIRTVWSGDYYFHSQYEKEIVQWLSKGVDQITPKLKFTTKELEIVLKLSKGMTCKEIGDAMQLSARTIEAYRADMIAKTKVKNSLELISFVYKNGIGS